MTAPAVPRPWDLLMVLTAAPYQDEGISSALLLASAVLDRGASTQVWTCGWASLLTRRELGAGKPRNLRRLSEEYPSTASMIAELLRRHDGRLRWNVCRFCSAERAAGEHIHGVRLRSPLKMTSLVAECAKTIYVGGS